MRASYVTSVSSAYVKSCRASVLLLSSTRRLNACNARQVSDGSVSVSPALRLLPSLFCPSHLVSNHQPSDPCITTWKLGDSSVSKWEREASTTRATRAEGALDEIRSTSLSTSSPPRCQLYAERWRCWRALAWLAALVCDDRWAKVVS